MSDWISSYKHIRKRPNRFEKCGASIDADPTAPEEYTVFSDHLRVIDQAPAKTLLLIAAGLVIVCQLVAMVLVSSAQVEKAELREASYASARAASIGCMQISQGAALKDCNSTPAPLPLEVSAPQALSSRQGIALANSSNRY